MKNARQDVICRGLVSWRHFIAEDVISHAAYGVQEGISGLRMSFLMALTVSRKAFPGSGCHFSLRLRCPGRHFRAQDVISQGVPRVLEGISGLRMSFLMA